MKLKSNGFRVDSIRDIEQHHLRLVSLLHPSALLPFVLLPFGQVPYIWGSPAAPGFQPLGRKIEGLSLTSIRQKSQDCAHGCLWATGSSLPLGEILGPT